MRINEIGVDYLKADQLKGPAATENGPGEAAQPTAPVKQPDTVRISDEARALARADSAEAGADRIDEIRTRILEGAYNSLDSVEQLARRMLASGDL